MYSISNVIYGIPLLLNGFEDQPEWIGELVDEEPPGILSYYHGGGVGDVVAFGVELGHFDECVAYHEGSKLLHMLSVTEDQVEEFQGLWDAVEPELRQKIEEYGGKPRIIVMLSTS